MASLVQLTSQLTKHVTRSRLEEMSNPRIGANGPTVALLNDIFQKGGVERVLSYMSLVLFKGPGIIFLFDPGRIDFDYRGTLVDLKVKSPPYGGMLEEAYCLLKGLFKLWRQKRRHGVDVCISHKEGPNFINILSAYSKCIVVVHEHKSSGIKYAGIKHTIVRWLVAILYNKADHVVTVSRTIAQDLESNFGVARNKLRVIYNPCDTDMIAERSSEPLEEQFERLFDARVIVTVGRLDRQKGHWYLLRAFSEIRKRVGDVRLVILGTGDHTKYLRDLADELEISAEVHFLGFQSNPFRFLRRSTLFVLTSLWEGFPAVLLEAMACRLPVIAADCLSGPRELLAPKLDLKSRFRETIFADYGILTPPLDGHYKSSKDQITKAELSIVEAATRVLGDSEMRRFYASRGYGRVNDFGMQNFAEEWSRLIDLTAGTVRRRL